MNKQLPTISIQQATTAASFKEIAQMAGTIWTEHYTPIIGSDQVEYMLQKFQTEAAIQAQVADGTLYFLLLYEKLPAGYISVYTKNKSLFLSKFYVYKTLRGKGIGKRAMEFVEDKATEMGCQSISLTVNKNNTGSIKAYEKLNFVNKGPIVIDIGKGYVMDDFAFEKELF